MPKAAILLRAFAPIALALSALWLTGLTDPARAAFDSHGDGRLLLADAARLVPPRPPEEEQPQPADTTAEEPEPAPEEAAMEAATQEPSAGPVQLQEEPEPQQRAAPAAQPQTAQMSDPPLPQPRPESRPEQPAPGESQPETAVEPPEPMDDGGNGTAMEIDESPRTGPDLDGPRMEPESDFVPEAEEAIREELEMGPRRSFRLSGSARLTEEGPVLSDGLIWRVFRAQPRPNGSFEMVEETRDPQPSFLLPSDEYILHVAYGLANTAKRVSLDGGHAEQELTIDAGGLRITAVDAQEREIARRDLSLSVYSSEEDEYGQRRLIIEDAEPNAIIRLNPGSYHLVSRYGDANAEVRADIQVNAGELTEAQVQHRSAAITLKLVNEFGGEALADTSWTILTPEGETVKESFGAFPTHILIEGDYTAVAQHNGEIFNRDFDVEPGADREIELIAD